MKIGIDIDGVILDSERNLKFYADYWSYFELNKNRQTDTEVSQSKCFGWTKEESDYFYGTLYDKISEQTNLMVGTKEILTKLKEEGHQLYVVTLRGYYREEERSAAESKLNQLGVEFDQVCWGIKDKIGKCEELGIELMIDDNPENVEQFASNKAIQVLYFKEAPVREVDMPNVTKVDNWMDIYREVKRFSK